MTLTIIMPIKKNREMEDKKVVALGAWRAHKHITVQKMK